MYGNLNRVNLVHSKAPMGVYGRCDWLAESLQEDMFQMHGLHLHKCFGGRGRYQYDASLIVFL